MTAAGAENEHGGHNVPGALQIVTQQNLYQGLCRLQGTSSPVFRMHPEATGNCETMWDTLIMDEQWRNLGVKERVCVGGD